MRTLNGVTLLVLVAWLVLAPTAAECSPKAAGDCSMSRCPMGTQMTRGSCHPSGSSPATIDTGCDDRSMLQAECCEAPARDAVLTDGSRSSWPGKLMTSTIPPQRLASERPPKPPDRLASVVAAREHDRGRFTLLSSLLI